MHNLPAGPVKLCENAQQHFIRHTQATPMPQSQRILLVPILAILGYGCTTAADKPDAAAPGLVNCTEPRPEMCTMQYDPVCGHLVSGARKTYGNACNACADKQVKGYQPGACP